jgi:Lon protease-like protein
MRLPLFPLPLVLFPGATLPLHLFEPRYRQLLTDCLAGDRRFGIIALPRGMAEPELPAGRVGCVAEITMHERLEDGRADIVVVGRERFALEALDDDDAPYRVGRVTAYEDVRGDDDDAESLDRLATEVRALWTRVAGAARRIADESDPVPALPDDPSLVAFAIAAVVDLDLDARQQLLTARSPAARLYTVRQLLGTVAGDVEERAEVHERAKTNGKGRH